MFPVYHAKSIGDIPLVSEPLLDLSPFSRSGRACQILFLEILKDGPVDLRNEFTYGGSSNYPVISQGLVSFSSSQVSEFLGQL